MAALLVLADQMSMGVSGLGDDEHIKSRGRRGGASKARPHRRKHGGARMSTADFYERRLLDSGGGLLSEKARGKIS